MASGCRVGQRSGACQPSFPKGQLFPNQPGLCILPSLHPQLPGFGEGFFCVAEGILPPSLSQPPPHRRAHAEECGPARVE